MDKNRNQVVESQGKVRKLESGIIAHIRDRNKSGIRK